MLLRSAFFGDEETSSGSQERFHWRALYHHVVEVSGIEMSEKKEERLASVFVREFMKKV